jgi:hypothetical protein
VYGAIDFYLGHQDEVEALMKERETMEDAFAEAHPAPPPIKQKLARARQQSPVRPG